MILGFEGLDYGGKSRLIEYIRSALAERGRDHLTIREPGGFSSLLRDYAIEDSTCESERAVMMLADRILTHGKVVKPYIKRHQDKEPIILSDRCYMTSLVYQGAMVGPEAVNEIAKMHAGLFAEKVILPPDVVFIIRPSINDVIKRMTNNPKDGKLQSTETLHKATLFARDQAYGQFKPGGMYEKVIPGVSPKIVEIFTDNIEAQLAIVMEYIPS